ncbi:cell division protein FtsQ/DivIB [Hellea balneolensis]|uniref:cell division protein FtsQ/DivIB n=1 Tax=Hellea balneolensis TaxID=287478 RepID=UPI00047EF013|nr:FtsQ-type POTRA domain-containing protein [Hellea balneolensis]
MAAVRKGKSIPKGSHRVSPLKPGLRGARNWASAKMRAASHTRKGFTRFALSILGTLLLVIFLGLWLGGFLPNVAQAGETFKRNRLMSMGFVIERVDVMGEGRLREEDVRRALGVYSGDYLFGVNIKEAQQRVESLSWVDRAVVRRLWPDRIVVQIIERQPYALWQHERDVKVVDIEGRSIIDAKVEAFTHLKLFVGEQAGEHAASVQSMMAEFPNIAPRVESYVNVSDRRWDLVLDEGALRVMLPEKNMKGALQNLQRLQVQTRILDRTIKTIDMRLHDRLTLSPSPPERA